MTVCKVQGVCIFCFFATGAFGKVFHGELKRSADKQIEHIAIKTIKSEYSIYYGLSSYTTCTTYPFSFFTKY